MHHLTFVEIGSAVAPTSIIIMGFSGWGDPGAKVPMGARRRARLHEGLVTDPPVILVADAVAGMVHAAARTCADPHLSFAVIGGFAVTCRLGRVHRATGDVDRVADEPAAVAGAGSSAHALVELGIATADPGGRDHRVFVDGTKIEIIETQELTTASLVDSVLDRLFSSYIDGRISPPNRYGSWSPERRST